MRSARITFYFSITAILLGFSLSSNAQLYSPGRDWAGSTQYSTGFVQDSIFVVFSSAASPKKGALKAKFSDGSLANFTWYQFNDAITNPLNRFVPIKSENGVTESNLTNLDKGGYRVSVTRISDNTTNTYTCWLMIDDVVITNIEVDNNCEYLYLNTKLQPSRYLIPDYFTYWDLSKSNQPEITKLGTSYCSNLTWLASNALVTYTSAPTRLEEFLPKKPTYLSPKRPKQILQFTPTSRVRGNRVEQVLKEKPHLS